MVATDVASRGIGEYNIPPLPPPPWQLPAEHLLYFTLVFRGSLDCAILPDNTLCPLGSQPTGS